MSEQPGERAVLDVLGDLRAGRIDGKSIDVETRRRCVEYLSCEGATNAEMTQLLGVTDRTIRRDRESIREANALKVDDGFVDRMAGEIVTEARLCVSRVRRISREKGAPAAARIEAERVAFEVTDRMTRRLQSMGFLPTATKRIKADLTHSVESLATTDEILAEIARLKSIDPDAGAESLGQLHEAARLLESPNAKQGEKQ
ncbi:MAG: hypothetical protein KDA31_13060 [Phycisphaerales bacterium]|nr:hypothetical protein [Phycisphaerales bacterium]